MKANKKNKYNIVTNCLDFWKLAPGGLEERKKREIKRQIEREREHM